MSCYFLGSPLFAFIPEFFLIALSVGDFAVKASDAITATSTITADVPL